MITPLTEALLAVRSLFDLVGVTSLGEWDLLAALHGDPAREVAAAQLAAEQGGDVAATAAGLERLEAGGLAAADALADGERHYRAASPGRAAQRDALTTLLRLAAGRGGRGLIEDGFRLSSAAPHDPGGMP